MTVSLEQINYGDQNYIAKLENNRAIIEAALNELYGYLSGGQTGGGGAVPLGLQEIFDRRGLIGIASYDFSEATLSGPDYNFSVAAGAYWYPGSFYSKSTSTTLSMAGKDTGTYYINLDATGAPILGTSANTTTTRQFEWNASTHVISSKALYSGVNILLDGDDWNDLLSSTTKGKSWDSVADRIEELEEDVDALDAPDMWGTYYQEDAASHSGLNFYYKAGKVRNDSVVYDTPAGYVALTDDQTNYVEVDPADGSVSANTTGFTSGQIPLFQVVTASGAIDTVTDKRTSAIAGTGGGGGSHTQGTDTGTTSTDFTIDSDATGSPTGKSGIVVENGDDPNALLQFDRNTGKWVYSEDGGSTWKNLGEIDFDLGVQTITQMVSMENPDKVHEEIGRGTSADYEDLDLSTYVTAPQGVEAVLLLVYFWDSAPGAGVNVLFKKKGSASNPIEGFTVWSGQTDPGLRLIPVDDDVVCQFFVNASGADTANLKIYLLGYHKKITGAGTQDVTFSPSSITVPASDNVEADKTGFINRGLVHYLKVAETGGLVTGTYDIEIFAKDTFLEADLLYKAEGIDPATDYEDWLPWFTRDDDATSELHVRITNSDAGESGVYEITIRAEQFA